MTGVEYEEAFTMSELRRTVPGIVRGNPVVIVVDGVAVQAFRGETIAAALLANGQRVLRRDVHSHAPRGLFCGMGVCFECAVTVNGVANLRSCMTHVEHGMTIVTGANQP
jgi:sarcosine oxidase subunit alpha